MDFGTLSRDHVLTHIWGRVNHPEALALPLPDLLYCKSEDIEFFQEQLAETLLENYSLITVYQYILLQALKQEINSTGFEICRFLSGSTEVLFESHPNSLSFKKRCWQVCCLLFPIRKFGKATKCRSKFKRRIIFITVWFVILMTC